MPHRVSPMSILRRCVGQSHQPALVAQADVDLGQARGRIVDGRIHRIDHDPDVRSLNRIEPVPLSCAQTLVQLAPAQGRELLPVQAVVYVIRARVVSGMVSPLPARYNRFLKIPARGGFVWAAGNCACDRYLT